MALADNLYVFWEPRSVITAVKHCTIARNVLDSSTLLAIAAGLDFVFHMFFLIKYSKSLEEGSFRGRSADFLWMLLIGQACLALGHPDYGCHRLETTALHKLSQLKKTLTALSAGGAVLTCCAPFVNIQFLGSSLTFMMVRKLLFHCSSPADYTEYPVAGSSCSRHSSTKACRCMCGRDGTSM